MAGLNRRNFLSSLLGTASAFALDPERLLWVPGKKLISIPAPTVDWLTAHDWMFKNNPLLYQLSQIDFGLVKGTGWTRIADCDFDGGREIRFPLTYPTRLL